MLEKVTLGFSSYLKTQDFDEELLNNSVPHPFDSHPPVAQRIKDIGVTLDLSEVRKQVVKTPKDSWFFEIEGAKEIQDGLIKDYEEEFLKQHETDLVYRYLPKNDEERILVEKHFPSTTFSSKDKKFKITFDYEKISCSDWSIPVYYNNINIKKLDKEESLMNYYIVFKLKKDTPPHKGKVKLCVTKTTEKPNTILEVLNLYFGRYLSAFEYSNKTSENP